MTEFDDELSAHEREAFAALPRETTPPSSLEKRVVNALKESHLIRPSAGGWQRPGIRVGVAIAASLALFFLGVAAGRREAAPGADQQLPEFLLVLRRSAQEPPDRSSEEMQRVKEYSAWAKRIRQEGLLVSGEKLKDEARVLNAINGQAIASETQAGVKENAIAGYFLIRARDYRHAETIAGSCPHLKYGGTIEIRQIDSVGN